MSQCVVRRAAANGSLVPPGGRDAGRSIRAGSCTSERWRDLSVYAVKYAEQVGRRAEHFLGGDPHDGPMPMDYFVWAVVGRRALRSSTPASREADARRRQRRLVRTVPDALAAVGVDAATVTDVVVTHLHYDHVGGCAHFPAARFHLQDKEMAYATGRHMAASRGRPGFTPDHVAGVVHHVFARGSLPRRRVTLASGVSLHLLGGHTTGTQAVRCERRRLARARLRRRHYYENFETGRPFPIVHDVGAVLDGYDTLVSLASDGPLVVPGHDPLVLERYPVAGPGLEGITVRLDEGRVGA